MSTDPLISRFASWNKIFVRYCDGSLHQGSRNDPILYKDTRLYFRGADNTRSHIQWLLNNYDFVNAEKVVFSGASAGGIATFHWTNYVRDLLKNPEVLYTIPDSGVFMNIKSPVNGQYVFDVPAQYLYKVANTDESTPVEPCNKKFAGEEHKCLFMENVFTSLKGRILVINSEYDEVGLEDMGITCFSGAKSKGKSFKNCNATEMGWIEAYRSAYMKFVENFLHFSTSNIWTIACCAHSYACYGWRYDVPEQKVPGDTGATVREAIDRFVFNDERVVMVDRVDWPNNAPCAY